MSSILAFDSINLSGTLLTVSAGGNLLINGSQLTAGTSLSVTGSSALSSANVTGVGSVGVSLVGSTLVITGTASNDSSSLLAYSGYATGTFETRGNSLANANNLSGRLTQTGVLLGASINTVATDTQSNATNISGNVTQTGVLLGALISTANANIAANATNLSGNLTQTGISLSAQISTVSVNTSANANNLSGNLTQTGAALFQRDLDISGALASQIAGGGSIVKVTGSSAIGTADFTGVGSVSVRMMGPSTVLISGATSEGGGLTMNQLLSQSADKYILFNSGQASISGDVDFQWDYSEKSLKINQPELLPDNPLAIGGSGAYLQLNIQNASTASDASSDFVATADNGTDTSNYVNLGINGSTYSQTGFTSVGPNDSYLYANGGHLVIGTQTSGKLVKIHVGGTTSGQVEMVMTSSGIDMPNGGAYMIGGRSLFQPLRVPFVTTAVTATNATLAPQFFANSFGYVARVDLRDYTGVQFVVNKVTTAGAANSAIFLRYLGHASTTASQYLAITSPEMRIPTNNQNTITVSGFQPIVNGAKSGVYLALITSGGDGVLDPVFGNTSAFFM